MIATDDIQELFCLNGIGATCPKITFPNFGLLFSQLLQTDVSQFQKTKKKRLKKIYGWMNLNFILSTKFAVE